MYHIFTRTLWKPLSLLLVVCGLFLAYLWLKPVPPALFTFGDDLLQGVSEVVGLLLALPILLPASTRERTAARSSPRWLAWWTPSGSAVPLLLACTLLSTLIGQVLWTLNEDVLHLAVLFPSWADAGYLGAYPFALLAILLLPQQRNSLASRTRMTFDAVITMTGVVTMSWYFVLGPTIQQGAGSVLGQFVGTAYPLSTLVLIFCLFLLTMRNNAPAMRPVIFLLFLAFAVITITDTIFAYQQLHSLFTTGSLLDLGWVLGYLLLGLAARSLYVLPQPGKQVAGQAATSERTARQPALWQTLLPYAWVPTVGVLLIFIWRRVGDPFLVIGVVAGAVVLVGLVLVRQLVAMRELHELYANNDALAAANRQLEVQATHDSLTGLPNRTLLQRRLEQATHLARKDDISAALLILDLDRFKEVNDTIGHQRGDQLLQQVGERLRQAVSAAATVARLGGDEFAVFLPVADEAGARQVVSAVGRALEEPFLVEGYPLHVEASVGVALSPAHGSEPLTLFQHADVAMYTAKLGHERFALYDASRDQYSPRRLALLGDLREAIAEGQLRLYYQPKADLQTGLVKSVEALVRWQHPTLGFIQPDQFIPLAEQTGLIVPLTHWVVATAIEQCRHWLDGGLELRVAVNLSMRNLRDTNLPDTIESLLAQYRVPPHLPCCEITESAVMGDAEHTLQVLNRLFELGVRISIDDYGTGYASLSYLKRLPADELKIDRAFVQYVTTDRSDQAIVGSTVNMAHNLGMCVVAEGVEDQATWDLLETLQCDIAQGYYLSRPIPAQDLERWLDEREEAAVRLLSTIN